MEGTIVGHLSICAKRRVGWRWEAGKVCGVRLERGKDKKKCERGGGDIRSGRA